LKISKMLRKFVTQLSDILLGVLIWALAISLGKHALADNLDTLVNTKIKEEFIRVDVDKMRAHLEYNRPPGDTSSNLSAVTSEVPLNYQDQIFNPVDTIALGEQSGRLDVPQVGIARKIDPAEEIEQKVMEEQAYQLYREHYRGAVQREFIKKLDDAGYKTTRNLAEEIRVKEAALNNSHPPYPSRSDRQN
jgi:hypothetical protein